MRRFTMTDQHVKLLRAAHVSWNGCEFGAPGIDCKRPYGTSDVINDIVQILELAGPPSDDWDSKPSESLKDSLRALHEETETALQIVLVTGSLSPGQYEADAYAQNWRRVG